MCCLVEKPEGSAASTAGLELVRCQEVKPPVRLWPEPLGPCGSDGDKARTRPLCSWFPTADGCSTRGSGGSHIPLQWWGHPLLLGDGLGAAQGTEPSVGTAEMG